MSQEFAFSRMVRQLTADCNTSTCRAHVLRHTL